MNNIVKTKILENGDKLVIIVIDGKYGKYEYAPKYSDLREAIKHLKKIYGAKEVKQELKLGQYDKEKIDPQIENEKHYEIEEGKRLRLLVEEASKSRKAALEDFSECSIFNY